MKSDTDGSGPAMPKLGGILVDFERVPSGAILDYLWELRDRFPGVPLDLTGASQDLRDLKRPVYSHKTTGSALSIASARAAVHGHLIVLVAPVLPDPVVIQGLLAAFELDELVGFTQPRFSDASNDDIWTLPGGAELGEERIPRQVLRLLPPTYLTTEFLAACVAIRREVAVGVAPEQEQSQGVLRALLNEMRNARRRGYRNLVLNQLVVPSAARRTEVYPTNTPPARRTPATQLPQSAFTDTWFDGSLNKRRESLVANACRATPSTRVPVLLDCRGVVTQHNGTSEAVFGLLDGLAADEPAWEIELLFRADAAVYHNVRTRFPTVRIRTTLPNRRYAAAVCLNQPWHITSVSELHDRALTIAFNILDTIAWDVVYLSNPAVDRAWHFIAEHADALLYISSFTKQRFNFRFPVNPSVHETVSYLSLAPEDYRDSRALGLPESDNILVFGNHYDHKAVTPTVELLSRAFPFHQIQAFGARSQPLHNVSNVQSGHQPVVDIDRLTATARVVVFPSYYEGFGLPVVKALAYGRTVVVRSSSLWHEIAGLMRMPGHLVEFVAPHDLVRAVGQVLAGEKTTSLSLGKRLADGEAPPDWTHCAGKLVQLVERTLAAADAKRWYARDRALALAQR